MLLKALTYDVRKARMIEEDGMYQQSAATIIQARARGILVRSRNITTYGESYRRMCQCLLQVQLPSESLSRSVYQVDKHTLVVPYKSKHSKPKPAWEQVFDIGVTIGETVNCGWHTFSEQLPCV